MQAAPLEDPPRDVESEESLAVRRQTATPAASGGMWLIASLALFVLAQTSSGVVGVVILVAVLMVHEGGHYLAMRAFGYRDLKVFFIPFFGAVATGRRGGVDAWKEAVVSLMGPLPGLVIGAVLAFAVHAPAPATKTLITSLVFINAFNLLPVGNLDGGHFFARILFSRHRYVEIAFGYLTGLALLGAAIKMKSWPIGVFAWLGVFVLPHRARLLAAAASVRVEVSGVSEMGALQGPQWVALLAAARTVFPSSRSPPPKALAQTMEAMLESLKPTPSIEGSIVLAAGWLFGVVVAAIGVYGAFGRSTPSFWHPQDLGQTGLSVEMPYRPATTAPTGFGPGKPITRLESGTRHWFAVTAWAVEPGRPSGTLADPADVVSRTDVAPGTFKGEEIAYRADGRSCKRRVLTNERFVVELEACAPEGDEAGNDRFVRSLRENVHAGPAAAAP